MFNYKQRHISEESKERYEQIFKHGKHAEDKPTEPFSKSPVWEKAVKKAKEFNDLRR